MALVAAWLAQGSGWRPGDREPRWTGRARFTGFDLDVSLTEVGPQGISAELTLVAPRVRGAQRRFEGVLFPAGSCSWKGDLGVLGDRWTVRAGRMIPPGIPDLPEDRQDRAAFALMHFEATRAAARQPDPPEDLGRDWLAILDGDGDGDGE